MNKHVYLDLSILDLSKTVMCEFWYKGGFRLRLVCRMMTSSFLKKIDTFYQM